MEQGVANTEREKTRMDLVVLDRIEGIAVNSWFFRSRSVEININENVCAGTVF